MQPPPFGGQYGALAPKPWSSKQASVTPVAPASTRKTDAESWSKSDGKVKLKGNPVRLPPSAKTEQFLVSLRFQVNGT